MKTRRALPALLAGGMVLLCLPTVASATALIDDPAVIDQVPASARAYFAQRDAAYQKWRAGQGSSRRLAMIVDAPHRVLGTTSHKQRRNDYCVPATTTIIDHYLRGAKSHWSQKRWASYRYSGVPLWTDRYGGSMWVMAMGLRAKTGKGYTYSSGNTARSVYSRTEYGIKVKRRPVAYGVRIYASRWPNYRVNHRGHIVSGRGFDWRYGRIYIADPHPENAAPPLGYGRAGGSTYGKKTYAKSVVAAGVVASASKQVVY